MSFYSSKEDIQEILSALWDKILINKPIVDSLGSVKIIVKFRFKDLDTSLYIINTEDEPFYCWDRDDIKPDVEMILDSNTAHLFWSEQLNIPLALATRKVVARGSINKALKLLPALKPAFAIYRDVLSDMERSDPVTGAVSPKKKKKNSRRLLNRKEKKSLLNTDALPRVPLKSLSEPLKEKKPIPLQKRAFTKTAVTPEVLLRMMYKIRFFEEHLSRDFAAGNIPTEAIHLSIGQEGVAAGVCMNLRPTDYLNTTHRGHGHILAKGANINLMMAELYGKKSGLCAGKGGSMHVTDSSCGILGANGIVGAGYLLAMGAGLSIKMQKSDDISVVIAGDGSVNQGMFHEALNMASLFKLPVLFIVENNLYGEFTHVDNHSAVPQLYRRAESYGLETMRLNGNDVLSLNKEIKEITDTIRSNGKPWFVECMTYRWHGHMEGDAELYRSEEEKKKYRDQDPVKKLENQLIHDGLTFNDISEISNHALEVVTDAVAFALAQDDPVPDNLMEDVFAPENPDLLSGPFPAPVPGSSSRFVTVSQAINEAISEEMSRDERVFLWGEDVCLGGYFNVTDGLMDQFGRDRIIDTPISENGIVGGAVGAAMTGSRPIAEILFADFLSCCMDPILNQAAKLRYMTGGQVSMPLTIRTPLGSGIGMAAQHSQSMEKFFIGIPGLIVAAPSDALTAKGLLKSAIRSNNPVLFFEHKLLYAMTSEIP
ncbi:MAG: hypothetical protein GY754_39130, partial [bacterium]|nr:hypothetical protein [bacterium]